MSSLLYPLPRSYPVTRGFGDTSITSVGSFGGIGAHTGVDLGAPCGTPILAAANGVVSKVITGAAALANLGGREIHITHSDNLLTIYAHASAVDVKQGQTVAGGQRIGAVGASGAATGCHLHFEVRVGGHPVDPGPLIGIGATAKGGSSTPSKSTEQAVLASTSNQATLASSNIDYGPIYPLLESEVQAWAASGQSPCAPGYHLGTVDPRINYLLDNPAGSGPKGAHWFQAPLVHEHLDWAAKLGISTNAQDPLRFACVRGDIQPGNVNAQQLVDWLKGPSLEVILNLAVLATGAAMTYAGIRQALRG